MTRRLLLAAALMAGLLLAGESPASASGTITGSGDWYWAVSASQTHVDIGFSCTAVATGDAVETRILREELDGCVLVRQGVPFATAPGQVVPGPVATTANVVRMPYGTVRVCWRARAKFADGSIQNADGCSPLLSVPPG